MKKILILILVLLILELGVLGFVNLKSGGKQCFLKGFFYPIQTAEYTERQINPCFENTFIFYSGIFNVIRNCSTKTTEIWENRKLLDTEVINSCEIEYYFFKF